MRRYEIMFIVRSDSSEEERKNLVTMLEKTFTDNKATITLSKDASVLVFENANTEIYDKIKFIDVWKN